MTPRRSNSQHARLNPARPGGTPSGVVVLIRTATWWIALAALLVALVASAFLVNKHFGGSLPGCGPKSGCEALDRSAWSRVPLPGGLLWPVSFLGLAHFSGMLGAWIASARRAGITVGVLAAVGVLDSLLFSGVMIYLKTWCTYCVTAHSANLVFAIAAWATIVRDFRKERAGMTDRQSWTLGRRIRAGLVRRAPVVFVVVFVATSTALGVASARHEASKAREAEAERARSVKAILDGDGPDPALAPFVLPDQPSASDRWGPAGFTGRYRKGPESAGIRIVVLTDFQCPDCKRVEGEVVAAMQALDTARAGAPDTPTVSLSIKHFPMCKDCNTYVPQTMHGNACYAARAAEAAGILGGDDAFFKFVQWLFEVDGKFETKEVLARGVERAGLTVGVDAFAAVMEGAEPLKRIQADVEDGMALGIFYTPMVFINGVELKGWQVAGSVRRTIDEIAARKPPSRTAAADHPVLAAQRYVDDWKEQPPARPFMEDLPEWSTGAPADWRPADPAKDASLVSVIVFGDYSEPATARLDSQLREAMKSGKGNVRYTFRHYPLNPECNPALPPNLNPAVVRENACLASRAVEAAGKVGGNSAYWKMHEWVMQHQASLRDSDVKAAAAAQGLDAAAYAAALASPDVMSAIRDDALAGQLAGLTSLPMVFVNGKQVPRPLREGDNVIKRVIDEAGRPAAK
ncbi:MAG: DsbA family protein [Phycisphaerales bacterium]